MYLGILGVSALAFACSTEFIPELNEKLRLVPFTADFKFAMTTTMIVDYVGCWIVEGVLKRAFSDYRPKDIAIRRPEQIAREDKRQAIEKEEAMRKMMEEKQRRERARIEDIERRKAELRARWGVQ
jgi:manganese-transporting P-type ATPase